ncbi:MAG TPA: hypothetical protein VJ846_02560 [Sphingomicrobium sp.]|nr:hypothetical protein [Sphingomicrobium sp.]
MGAPGAGMKAADQPAAESLLTAFKTLSAAERRRHASVLNYWLSVRGDKEFPPLHDLDPLELSDAGPNSVLMELISGGHDAEIRHLGEALRDEAWPERIIDAPNPSVLACIAKKLPIVAISRDFLAFEDEYETEAGKTHCSVTLLPLSAGGAWVDYVYALVSTETPGAKASKDSPKKAKEPEAKAAAEEPEQSDEDEEAGIAAAAEEVPETSSSEALVGESVEESAEVADAEPEPRIEPELEPESEAEPEPEPEPQAAPAAASKAAPGFSKLLDSIAGLTGFYGSQPVKVEPVVEDEYEGEEEALGETPGEEIDAEEAFAHEEEAEEGQLEEPLAEEAEDEEQVADAPTSTKSDTQEPAADEPPHLATKQSARSAPEESLQNKLTLVRAKADEARMARLRANAALYEGLAAAYDFALDAEDAPEEYLRLVEAQGLKIQLRSPMKPVVKLAFAGMCDEATIKQLEAVLAWAFEEELPRGTLAERLESAGGIGPILSGQAKAA